MGFNDQQNKRISNFIIDELRLNPISDEIPKKVVPSIQPVFEVNKKIPNVGGSGTTASSNNSVTLITASATTDTYLLGYSLGLAKDATADVTNGSMSLTCTINGSTVNLAVIPFVTLVANTTVITGSFPTPVKIDRSTTVRFTSPTFTAGTIRASGSVFGFTQDTGDVTP